jgi:hypothetical protein
MERLWELLDNLKEIVTELVMEHVMSVGEICFLVKGKAIETKIVQRHITVITDETKDGCEVGHKI